MTEDELFSKSERITRRIQLDAERLGGLASTAKQKIECECMSVDKAREKYPFDHLQQLSSYDDRMPVLVVKGNVTGSTTLNRTWARRIASRLKLQGDPVCVLVDGTVEIRGDVLDQRRADFSLLVTGSVGCDYLLSRNGHMEVLGDLRATYGVCGEYNDGRLAVGGQLLAPYIVANDHDMPRQADQEFIYLEAGDGMEEIAIGKSKGSGWGWNWNYFDESNSLVSDEVWEEDGSFSTTAFFDIVRRGANPFAKP